MFGINRPKAAPTQPKRLDDGPLGHQAQAMAEKLIEVGIGGKASFDSATKIADKALQKSGGNVEAAVDHIISEHRKLVAAGGFLTGLGGFITMPVALPANVLEFYLLSTRMVGAITKVRGYDLAAPAQRTAILLALVGADADELIKKAGVISTGRLANIASQRLPAPALMVVNKAVGFRLVGQVGNSAIARLGKGVPFAGGIIGAGLDVYLFNKIANNAKTQFPPQQAQLTS